jgi:hypothetical protein
MDSAIIAPVLEKQVPEPSLNLENELHNKVGPLVGQSIGPLMPKVYARIGEVIIPDSYREEWVKGKEAQFGCTMQENVERAGGDQAWKNAEPGFKTLGEFMKANKKDDGPFILGSQVCYADFVLVGLVECAKKMGGEFFDRFVEMEPQLGTLYNACKPWLENDQ